MKLELLLATAAALLFSMAVAPPAKSPKPDFSGTWKLNLKKSKLEIPPPTATILRIDHRDPEFHLTRTHFSADKQDTFSIHLRTDGRFSEHVLNGTRARARAYWEGESLVFDTVLFAGSDEATNLVRYTLSADRRTLTADERFASEKLQYHNLWVMDNE